MATVATEHSITATSRTGPDGKMDIADLREFLASIPQTAGNNSAVPKVRTTFGGHIKSVSVTVTAVAVREDEGS